MKDIGIDLLYSSTLLEGTNSLSDFHAWFSERMQAGNFEVEITPLNSLQGWSFDTDTGTFGHESGKFFKINGLHVEQERNGYIRQWTQPIVNQPEVGLLGLLAKKISGVIHVLVQAKMEPGNVGFIQISPTVQATRSNYTRVHGGRSPKFIEYFLGKKLGVTVFDQLRSEQGTRYYRKRNRNMLVLLEEDALVASDNDFFWLTLGQLRELHNVPNLVHLDCRSIIGAMPFTIADELNNTAQMPLVSSDALESLHCTDSRALHSRRDLLSWLTDQKVNTVKQTSLVSIAEAQDWHFDGDAIRHDCGRYFDIVGVTVFSPSREVASWSQPLMQSASGGMIGLIAQVHNGVLHFLIQGRFEAGLIDSIEMAPTVQFTPKNYESSTENQTPCFVDYFEKEINSEILVDTVLSDEGGRFFKSEQRHTIIKIPSNEKIFVPESYRWMTLSQLHYFGSMELTINIELRSLIFCLSLA